VGEKMCQVVEAEFVLIHKLKNNHSCTINELVDSKSKIESKLQEVFIDVSKRSVENSVYNFPAVFKYTDNKIEKVDGSEEYFKSPLIDYFNCKVDEKYRSEIEGMLENQ
jgi:hypothetical protein